MSDEEILIQPVENPIICSPYREPDYHWLYDLSTGIPQKIQGRRPASYWFKSEEARAGSAQMRLLAEENREDLPMVNALREDVRRWRESSYENASQVTKQLLGHWSRLDRARRLFFCQIEAVETIIYLREILAQHRLAAGDLPPLAPHRPGLIHDPADLVEGELGGLFRRPRGEPHPAVPAGIVAPVGQVERALERKARQLLQDRSNRTPSRVIPREGTRRTTGFCHRRDT